MNNTHIKNTIDIDGYTYERYIPTVLKPYKAWFQSIYFKRKVRLALQALRGSEILYMKNPNGEVIGYLHLEKGNARYPWSKKKDWIISPYAIREDCRGKGLGSRLIRDFRITLSNGLSGDVYAEVRKTNLASMRALEKNGFVKVCNAKIDSGSLFRKYVVSDIEFEYIVYRMMRNDHK